MSECIQSVLPKEIPKPVIQKLTTIQDNSGRSALLAAALQFSACDDAGAPVLHGAI